MPTNLISGQTEDNALYIIKINKNHLKPSINLELLTLLAYLCLCLLLFSKTYLM